MEHFDRWGAAFGHFAISCRPQNWLNAEGKRFRFFFFMPIALRTAGDIFKLFFCPGRISNQNLTQRCYRFSAIRLKEKGPGGQGL
jgi:hypothetical protein